MPVDYQEVIYDISITEKVVLFRQGKIIKEGNNLRKVFWLGLVLALVFGSLSVQADEKVLIVGMTQEPDGFGSMYSMVAATTIEGFLYSGLIYRDNDWEVHPNMATYRPSVEEGTWQVVEAAEIMEVHWELRDDVYWHDGEPVTAHDFLLGYNITMDPGYPAISKAVANRIESIEIINDKEFRIYYHELYPFADQVLGFIPMPQHIFGDLYRTEGVQGVIDHNYWREGFIGTGPYVINDWVFGSHMELVPNKNFHLGEPIIDEIIVRFIEDTETLRFMLETGEIDISVQPTLPFDTAMALRRATDPAELHVEFTPSTTWQHIDMNTRDFEPFQDVRVRQALLKALDRQEIMDTVFEGFMPVAHTFQTPQHPLYTADVEDVLTRYEYNPERARDLLHEAGFEPGPDGIMTCTETGTRLELDFRTTAGNRPRELVQEAVAEYWGEIGVAVDINNMTAGALFQPDHFYRREWPNLILFAWSSPPTSLGDTLWVTEQIPTEENSWVGQNIAGYSNPRVDELFDKMIGTMSEAERQRQNVEIQQHWTADLPSLPLWFDVDVTVWRTNVLNIMPTGSADPDTWNAHLWDIQ